MSRHQGVWCFAAVAVGLLLGDVVPGVAEAASALVAPALVVLLFTTFTEIPIERFAAAARVGRFGPVVLALNFLVVPLVVAGLHWAIPLPSTVVVPVLIVLLTPCIDYVIVFTGLAGGASARLLALTPILMVVQMLLLPVWLRVILGEDSPVLIPPGPFVTALVLFVVVPLTAALAVRMSARRFTGAARTVVLSGRAMLPVLLATLVVIAAAEARTALANIGELGAAVLAYGLFAVIMVGLGWLAARWALRDQGERRALVFTGVTRNSLVVLPVVRAVDGQGLGTAAVVTQTLLELIVMALLVWLVPRLFAPAAMSENR